jgi:hypothetical protein
MSHKNRRPKLIHFVLQPIPKNVATPIGKETWIKLSGAASVPKSRQGPVGGKYQVQEVSADGKSEQVDFDHADQ